MSGRPASADGLDRRQFLARVGVLGAAAAVGLPRVASAEPPEPLGSLLQELARDTISGLVAFVVPGPDAYSVQQGLTAPEAGGIDAATTDFMLTSLDNFYPFQDQLVGPLARALATGLTDGAARAGTPLDLPGPLVGVVDEHVRTLDDALAPVLTTDYTAPLSVVISLLLNTMATWVDPASLSGPFPAAPFANLSFDAKVEVFRRMEEDAAATAASFDGDLPEPLRHSLSGLMAFVPGALLEFVGFGTYSEWSAADRTTGQLVGTPVGWQLTGYLAETDFTPVDGWADLRGYYAGRTSADS